jgi:hypothetical protein
MKNPPDASLWVGYSVRKGFLTAQRSKIPDGAAFLTLL